MTTEPTETISKHPRSKKSWDRREVKRCMVLLANGYEKPEVSEHIGRGITSINGMLADYGVTLEILREKRGLTKMQMLDLPNLPAFDPMVPYRAVEEDFPGLTLLPPAPVPVVETRSLDPVRTVQDMANPFNGPILDQAVSECLVAAVPFTKLKVE